MTTKLASLTREDRLEAFEEIDAHAQPFDNARETNTRPRHAEYGICATCISFFCAETEFEIQVARCTDRNTGRMILRSDKPILRCSGYEEVGQMDLFTMKQIAWLIDPPKRTAGFIQED